MITLSSCSRTTPQMLTTVMPAVKRHTFRSVSISNLSPARPSVLSGRMTFHAARCINRVSAMPHRACHRKNAKIEAWTKIDPQAY